MGAWILVAAILLQGCASSRQPAVIAADRTISPLPDGRVAVSATWLQERYQLERALRLRIERCEAK